GKIAGQVGTGATPSHIAVGKGAAWVTNADSNTVSRIDPATKQLVDTIDVGSEPSGIAVGHGAVWVANSLDGTVSEINAENNNIVNSFDVGNGPAGVAYLDRGVWVANTGDRTITRIDAETGAAKTYPIAATELAAGNGYLWASQQSADRVVKVDPYSGAVDQTIPVGNGPTGLAVSDGKVWVANSLAGTVSPIDPVTDAVTSASVGNGVTSLAAGAGGVWVSSQFDGTLSRIDPSTNEVVRRIAVGNRPQGVGVLGDHVLIGVRASGAGHRGGTLVMRLGRTTSSLDPARAYDSTAWAILRMVGDGLVALNQASGLAGT